MANPEYSKFAAVARFDTAANAAEITPNDTVELAQVCACIRVGGEGVVKVRHAGNQAIVSYAVAAGEILRVKADVVYATDTTATNLVAWW